jgi:hypothetical protein
MPTTVWARWKRVAQRAAEFQANALFFLLYFVAIVPMALFRLGGAGHRTKPDQHGPRWIPRDPASADLTSVRRQF